MDFVGIGVDTGGTFTDLVAWRLGDRQPLAQQKVASQPSAPHEAVLDGIRTLLSTSGIDPSSVSHVAHGTTIALNAILQGTYPPVGVLTTEGFRDILEIGRQARGGEVDRTSTGAIYDVNYLKARPIVRRQLRLGVPERVDAQGRILRPLDIEVLDQATDELVVTHGVRAVAVCFLNSYANPAHESAAVARIAQRHPEVSVFASHELASEIREYERFSTVVLNAAVSPVLSSYLTSLRDDLHQLFGRPMPLYLMQAGGVLAPVSLAIERAISTVQSGIVGGVLGAAYLARSADVAGEGFLSMDMGGTSTDISLSTNGEPRLAYEGYLGSFPIRMPRVDVSSIGAGGGSIAWVDGAGLLRVGPQSAGADPGPVGYGRGGTEPTITDAHLVLGRLSHEARLAGAIGLQLEASRRAIEERVAKPLGISVEDAAAGIVAVANATMASGLRKASVERGIDPRPLVLIACGGAGPLHARDLAVDLGNRKMLLSAASGVMSALGMLIPQAGLDVVQTVLIEVTAAAIPEARQVVKQLQAALNERLISMQIATDGVDSVVADMRYIGQGYELAIAFPEGLTDLPSEAAAEQLCSRFRDAHEREYGHASQTAPVEIVNLRVSRSISVDGQIGGLLDPEIPREHNTPPKGPEKSRRRVFLDATNGFVDAVVYEWEQLTSGDVIRGPAIFEHRNTTALIGVGDVASVKPNLDLLVEVSMDSEQS